MVKTFFKDKFDFYLTGIYQGSKKEQLAFINKQLCEFSGLAYPAVDNWFDAFNQSKHYLSANQYPESSPPDHGYHLWYERQCIFGDDTKRNYAGRFVQGINIEYPFLVSQDRD